MHVILDHGACVYVQCLTGRLNLPLSIKKPPALLCSAWSWIKPGLHIWSCWVCYRKYTSLVEDCILFCTSLDQQWAWIQSSGRVFQLAWAGTEFIKFSVRLRLHNRQRINKGSVLFFCTYFAEWRPIHKMLAQKYYFKNVKGISEILHWNLWWFNYYFLICVFELIVWMNYLMTRS